MAWRPVTAALALIATAASAAAASNVPGDTMFYKSNAGAALEVKSAPLPTNNFTVRGPQAREIFTMDFDNAGAVLWGIDNATREVGTINLLTGAFTVVSTISPPLGANDFIVGMSFDPTTSNVYISTQNTSGAAHLHTIVVATGARTLVANLLPGFVAIAIDNGGQMFGLNIITNSLYRIDKATAGSTVVGSTGLDFPIAPMGMDFDPSDGTLYGCIVVDDVPITGHLVSFDPVAGSATILANFGVDEAYECAVDLPAAPTAGLAPVTMAVDTGGNGVLQPNETAVVVAPTWRNIGVAATVSGIATAFGGPPGPTYTIDDSAASYGSIGQGAQSSCASTSDCYAFTVSATARPAAHWDAAFDETLTPGGAVKTWALHIGDSFGDVPAANPFYRFIETLLHNAVTGGCTATDYCPATATTREQMAVFVLTAKEGSGYAPPPCTGGMFNDVDPGSPFCPWIEELASRGVVGGCGGNNYCPGAAVTRDAMAVFTLRTLDPSFTPPDCGTPMFADLPASSPFCKWVEELARRAVVTGCGGGNYCPFAPVTREQMGVFLSVAFGLVLYGV